MAELLALGVSHKTAPLDLRERLSLTEGRAVGALHDLTGSEGIHEAAAISTCNRTELYLVVTEAVEAENVALGALSRQAGIRPTELIESLYSYRGIEAARHLYRVAAGLDSMILGEAEIQGQVKRAYELALVEGATGAILNRLFRGALAAGKRVRGETRIGEGGISVPSAAVELATRTLGDLTGRHVLLIGAGETAELTARALTARGVETVFVANRRYDRAIGLAERFGGSAVRLEDLPAQLEVADIVVASTNSPHHLVEREELKLVAAAREYRPLLLIDLAVPRDIEPEVARLSDVYLYTVDDLSTLVQTAGEKRQAAVQQAEAIIETGVQSFEHWLGQRESVPLIQALHTQADGWRSAEIARARKMLARGDDIDVVMDALSRGLTQKMLHGTLAELHAADAGQRAQLAQTVSRLFLRQNARDPADDKPR